MTYNSGSAVTNYTYNADGIRTTKTVGGTKTEFFLNGSTVLAQKTSSTVMPFYYDANGTRIAFKYNGTMYYYVYNLQGDVTHIMKSDGSIVGTYEYDAWGKITNLSSLTTIAGVNPFRYRGYYYDNESGLYYLNSRYYNPKWGRFINADGYVSTDQDINGNNMFVYCGNNPVNRSDPSGMFWKEIGNCIKNAWDRVTTFASNTFGSGRSTSVTISKFEVEYLPDPFPITAKTGTKTTQTIFKHGNFSKPVFAYAKIDAEHLIKSSSVGIKINIAKFTLDISLGLDNTGIYGSMANGDTTNSFGIKANLSELKIGFEHSTAIKWDNTTETTYNNVSISGWSIAAAYIFATAGQPMPSPSYAYGT